MLDLSENIWFPHIHRTIVQITRRQCTEQGKTLEEVIKKSQSFQMEPVVEPNEEVRLDFARPLPDELNKDAYSLVAVDKWSKLPAPKVDSNTTADIPFKFMRRYISNNGVARKHKFD